MPQHQAVHVSHRDEVARHRLSLLSPICPPWRPVNPCGQVKARDDRESTC